MAEFTKVDLKAVKTDWDEVERKIQEHRKKRMIRILIVVAICIVLFLLCMIFRHVKHYYAYRPLTSIERTDTEATQFSQFQGKEVKYSNDGASLIDVNGDTVWTQSFDMQDPVLAVRNEYLAFADRGGKVIYILNGEGLQGKVSVDLPIDKIDVSDKGTVAALMTENSAAHLGLYDLSGTRLVEGALHFENSGVPMDLSISSDGMKLAMSLLDIETGQCRSSINVYDFDAAGQQKTDNLAGTFQYEDTVIPEIAYLDNDRLIAFADNKLIPLTAGTKPGEGRIVELDKEVKAVFHSDRYVGLLLAQGSKKSGNTLAIYNESGTVVKEIPLDEGYSKASFLYNGEICLLRGKRCAIYTMNGLQKYKGNSNTTNYEVLSTGRYRRYLFIREGKTELVRLKLFGKS